MPATLSLTYIDHSRESGSVIGNIPVITAANFAATLTKINTLVLAADDILLGNLNQRIMSLIVAGSGATPSNEQAQRENKWVVHYSDASPTLAAGVDNPYYGKAFVTSFGTAELIGLLSPNTDFANLAEADVATFIDAFQAFARSPSGGIVVVNSIEHVGRK